MAADTDLQIWGLGHLAGATVGVLVAGVYMGDYTVAANGSVLVTYGDDDSGKITASYLATNFSSASSLAGSDHDATFTVFDGTNYTEVTVPVLAGLKYTATGQLVRPILPEALFGGKGLTLGKMRRGHKYAMLVEGLHAIEVGTSSTNLIAASVTSDGGLSPELAVDSDENFTGVLVQPLADDSGYDAQLMWRSTAPYRLTIAMTAVFADGEE